MVATQGQHGVGGGRFGIVEVLEWIGEAIPELGEIDRMRPARPIDWSATDGHPSLHGVLVRNQRDLDRFTPVVERSVDGSWQSHFLVGTDELERLAESRFGLT